MSSPPQNSLSTATTTAPTIKFLCSYGGKILPRPSDGHLRYIGGLTRVVSVSRSVQFSELAEKLRDLCGYTATLRVQLPTEDLDILISIKSDEDLSNVLEVYDKASIISGKEMKIRAILSHYKSKSLSSPASPTSSASSSPDISPSALYQRRWSHHHRPPLPRRVYQYKVVGDCYHNYYPCNLQAFNNSRPRSSDFEPKHSNLWH